jgi:hypothetical protein
MSHSTSENGRLLTLNKLLERQVIIPIIQRDYAQGRNEQMVEEIRERFLASLHEAVSGKTELVLDFVYGSLRNTTFIPIDGQQRLTTLFLLHWYLAMYEKIATDEYSYLKNFTYDIRESANEFCQKLVFNTIDISQRDSTLSYKIRNANWYHHVYENDPTVQAMLQMLDAIDKKFYGIEGGYANLVKNGKVSFWWLFLEDFGLTDDLFIKMNARGKNLTRFEKFKVEAEQAMDTFAKISSLKDLLDSWLDNIDNDWLDTFWTQTEDPEKDAENNMFRFILFLLRSLATEKNRKYEETGQLEFTNTENDIETIKEAESFQFLCDALDTWGVHFQYEPIKNMFENIISKETVSFFDRMIIFGVILYGNRHPDNRINNTFFRILKYLAIGQRHVREDSKKFENDINSENYGSFIKYLRHFINGIPEDGNIIGILKALIDTPDAMMTFRNTKEKAAYCLADSGIHQSRWDDIQALEDMDCFCGQIHNVFFNGQLWLSPQKVEQLINLQKEDPHFLLRCIQAMSEDTLLTDKYHGSWKWTKTDEGEDQFILHKRFFGFSESGWGDYLWTANPNLDRDLSKAVRGFIQECAGLPFKNIRDELNIWLMQKIKNQKSYTYLAAYIAKYEEFTGDADEKTNGCVYLIPDNYISVLHSDCTRIFGKLESGHYGLFWEYGAHYNPFVTTLHNLLETHNTTVRITNKWMCKESAPNQLDEWVELSNGRKIRLMIKENRERYWELDDKTTWDCDNSDCIDVAFQNIKTM